jgi:glycine cleavage system aminomethyltransferase T
MPSESLAAALARVGSPVELLRNLDFPPSTFPVRPEFTNWRSEQRAWLDSCALLDQSHHMTDLFVEGPDALRLFSELAVNTFAAFGPGRAKQFVAVGPDGHLIGDAILFHLDEDSFDLVGHPMAIDWVTFSAERGGHRVTLRRDDNSIVRTSGPPALYRYELQGPTSLALLAQVTGAPVPEARFFSMADLTIAGRRVRGLRHGMAGQPGFELFGPWEDGEAVLAALLEAGADHGLVRVGAKAYSTANLGSGWVPAPLPAVFGDDPLLGAYRDWLPLEKVGSIGGSLNSADIADWYLTPWDIGYGKTIRFDHDFVGREALEAMAAAMAGSAPPRTKVTLVWDADDVTAAIGTMYTPGPGAKYVEMPKARYATHHEDEVRVDGQRVGVSLDCGYLANERQMVSLATVDTALAEPGTEVTVLWGEDPVSAKPAVEPHRQVEIRAVVAPCPYDAREGYRSR